jgi:hypothetical protein
MKKIIEFRMAEDCCVICGDHASLGGGHYFRGWKVGNGWYMDSEGWLCNKKKVWICPTCCEAIVKIYLKHTEEIVNLDTKILDKPEQAIALHLMEMKGKKGDNNDD